MFKKYIYLIFVIVSIITNISCSSDSSSCPDCSDAGLTGITASTGNLQPAFSKDTMNYLIAPVSYNTISIGITPVSVSTNASILIKNTTVKSGNEIIISSLEVGPNPVSVLVTSEDGKIQKTYNIIIYRAIPVFKTGQTSTYASGDDGDVYMGVEWPEPRFTINSGVINDNMTGLTWQKSSILISSYSWGQLQEDINSMNSSNFQGFNDWRMPNIIELESLLRPYNGTTLDTILKNEGFDFTTISLFSNTFMLNSGNIEASGIDILLSDSNSDVALSDYIPVRGQSTILNQSGQTNVYKSNDDAATKSGIAWPVPRFYDKNDGTVIDNMTALIWEKTPSNIVKKWSDCLVYVTSLNSSSSYGYNNWRMANVNELKTLRNFSCSFPVWLNSVGFNNVPSGRFWTSTTCYVSTQEHYYIDELNEIVADMTDSSYYCFAVTGGQ